jgi:hypothetical protein
LGYYESIVIKYETDNEPIRLYFYVKKGKCMEKLQLSTGEQIEVENGSQENIIRVKLADLNDYPELIKKFTTQKPFSYSILNEAGKECSNYDNKEYKNSTTAPYGDASNEYTIVTIILGDFDSTKQELQEAKEEIKNLKETVDTLVLNALGVDVPSETEEQQEEGEENETDVDETVQE